MSPSALGQWHENGGSDRTTTRGFREIRSIPENELQKTSSNVIQVKMKEGHRKSTARKGCGGIICRSVIRSEEK